MVTMAAKTPGTRPPIPLPATTANESQAAAVVLDSPPMGEDANVSGRTPDLLDLRTADWEHPYPYALVELGREDDWRRLADIYVRQPVEFETAQDNINSKDLARPVLTDRPFLRCLSVAKANGARTAVIETRYIDADYRSEYSVFYSKAFAHYEDSAHRIHFFAAELAAEDVWRLSDDPGYLGYIIVRPHVRGIVGRTMLLPPPNLKGAVRTAVREQVDFFGQPLSVRAVPFMQQDSRLCACAQAAAWMCHYTAYRRGDRAVRRRVIAEFTAAAESSLSAGRMIPSNGLTIEQLSQVLTGFGLPPIIEKIEHLDWSDLPLELRPDSNGSLTDERISASAAARLCCRYLNSGVPLIGIVRQWAPSATTSGHHAVVVCGYSRPDNESPVRLIVNDDGRGPYLEVADILADSDADTQVRRDWQTLMIPVPEKLWMTGTGAERRGLLYLLAASREGSREYPAAGRIVELQEKRELEVRTYFSTSNRFKERLRKRCFDGVVLREYAFARMPRFVWVVEAIDRRARDRGTSLGISYENNQCVAGEVIFDATSDDSDPRVVATRIPGLVKVRLAFTAAYAGSIDPAHACGGDLIASGGQYGP
jgi:hypothetical protein